MSGIGSYHKSIEDSKQFLDLTDTKLKGITASNEKFDVQSVITDIQEHLLDTLGTLEIDKQVTNKVNKTSVYLDSKVQDLQNTLNDANTKIITLNVRKTALEGRITTLNTNMPTLETAFYTAETAYNTAALTPPISTAISSNHNNAKIALNQAKSELAQKEAELKQVETELQHYQKIKDNLDNAGLGVYNRMNFLKGKYTAIKDEVVKFNCSGKLNALPIIPGFVGTQTFVTYAGGATGGAISAPNAFRSVASTGLQASLHNQDGEKIDSGGILHNVQIEGESGSFTLSGITIDAHTGDLNFNNATLTDSSGHTYDKDPIKIKLQVGLTNALNTLLIDTTHPRPLSVSHRKTIEVTIAHPSLTPTIRSNIYDTSVLPTNNPRLDSVYHSDDDLGYKKIRKTVMLEFLKEIHPKLHDSLTSEYQKDRFCERFGTYITSAGIVGFACDQTQLHTQFKAIALKKTEKFKGSQNQYTAHLHTQVNTHLRDRYTQAITDNMKSGNLYVPPNDTAIYNALAQYEHDRMQDTIDTQTMWTSLNPALNHTDNQVGGSKKNRHRGNILTRPVRWIANTLWKDNWKNKLDKTKTAIDLTPWTSFFEGNDLKSEGSYMDKAHNKQHKFTITGTYRIQSFAELIIEIDGAKYELGATETIPQMIDTVLADDRIPQKMRPYIALHIIKMLAQSASQKCGPLTFGNHKITFDKQGMMKIQRLTGGAWNTTIDEKHLVDTGNQADRIDGIQNARIGLHKVMSGYNDHIYKSLTKHRNSRLTKKKIKGNFDFKVGPHQFVYKDGAITTTVNGKQRTYTDLEYLLCHNDFYGHQIEIIKTLNQKLIDVAFQRPKTKKYYYYAQDRVTGNTYVIFNDGKIGKYVGNNALTGHGKTQTPLGGTRNDPQTENYVLSNPQLMSQFFKMMK